MYCSWKKKQFICALGLDNHACIWIETVSPEGTFCDTMQVPSIAGDMELN